MRKDVLLKGNVKACGILAMKRDNLRHLHGEQGMLGVILARNMVLWGFIGARINDLLLNIVNIGGNMGNTKIERIIKPSGDIKIEKIRFQGDLHKKDWDYFDFPCGEVLLKDTEYTITVHIREKK